uniref:Uncharacterized protein n=1 Tax=Arion vulgaris TaxID=1028688 RepID=A0A0B7A8T8_9EUPU
MERNSRNMDYAVERYQRDGRAVTQQNDRQRDGYDQILPYQVQRKPSYNELLPIQAQKSADKEVKSKNIKATQNAAAIMHYSNVDGKVREGRQAAVVAQMHQNDLHSVHMPNDLSLVKENGVKPKKSKNYVKQNLNLQSKYSRAQSTGNQEHVSGKNGSNYNSNLSTSFDPIKDRHLWTMWRTAVNGRIVDEVRHLEKIKNQKAITQSSEDDSSIPGMYGKALVMPPLKRFIKFDDNSEVVASKMSSLGQGTLETSQFVYYGLPRVLVSNIRK